MKRVDLTQNFWSCFIVKSKWHTMYVHTYVRFLVLFFLFLLLMRHLIWYQILIFVIWMEHSLLQAETRRNSNPGGKKTRLNHFRCGNGVGWQLRLMMTIGWFPPPSVNGAGLSGVKRASTLDANRVVTKTEKFET